MRAGPDAAEGVLAYLNGQEIREEDKCTEALSGATIAQSQSLEYLGRKVLMFVFSVRVLLHYRCLAFLPHLLRQIDADMNPFCPLFPSVGHSCSQ